MLPPAILQALAAYAARRRRLALVRGAGEAVAALAIGIGVLAVVDAWLRPGAEARWWMAMATQIAALGVFASRGVAPAWRAGGGATAARSIESGLGDVDQRITSAVDWAARPPVGVSAWMVERTVALAARQAAALDLVALVPSAPARRAWAYAALAAAGAILVLLAVGGSVAGAMALLARASLPGADVARPARVALAVSPGNRLVARGSALELAVTATPDPGSAAVAMDWDGGGAETIALEGAGEAGRYALRLPAVTRGFAYRIRAGDGESGLLRIDVSPTVRLERIVLTVVPPVYSGLPTRTVDGGDAEVVSGSTVRIVATFTGGRDTGAGADAETTSTGGGVASAALIGDDGEQAMHVEGGVASATFVVRCDQTYRLRVVGLGAPGTAMVVEPALRFRLRVHPDAPPTVTVGIPGLEARLLGSDETVWLRGTAGDDIGLASIGVEVAVDGLAPRSEADSAGGRPTPPAPPHGARQAAVAVAIDLRALGVRVGDALTVTAVVGDVGGQIARSMPIGFAIAPPVDARGAALAMRLRAVLDHLGRATVAIADEARAWNALGRAFRVEDPAAQRGELRLAADRSTAWAHGLSARAKALLDESRGPGAMPTGAAEALIVLGRELSAWADAQADHLRSAADAAQGGDADGLDAGQALCERAGADLGALTRDIALLIARLDADGLVAAGAVARARIARIAPVVADDRRGMQAPWRPGLAGEFHRGREALGEPAMAEIGLPMLAQGLPVGLAEEEEAWVGQWNGEIRLDAGVTVFAVATSGGVRLTVAGSPLLPPTAWSRPAVAEYRGSVAVDRAGWYPVTIEAIHAPGTPAGSTGAPAGSTGGASLRIAVVEAADHRRELAMERLRCRGIEPEREADGHLPPASTDRPRPAADEAGRRLGAVLADVARMPTMIAQLGAMIDRSSAAGPPGAASVRLARLADTRRSIAAEVEATLPDIAAWTAGDVRLARIRAGALIAVAEQARTQLISDLDGAIARRLAPGPFAGLRMDAERVVALASSPRVGGRSPESSADPLDSGPERTAAALSAVLRRIAAGAASARRPLIAEAVAADAGAERRAAAIGALRRLDDAAQAAARLRALTSSGRADAAGDGSSAPMPRPVDARDLDAAARSLAGSIASAAREADTARRIARAQRVSALSDADPVDAGGSLATVEGSAAHRAAMVDTARALAEDERAVGDPRLAVRLEDCLPGSGQAIAPGHTLRLRALLHRLADAPSSGGLDRDSLVRLAAAGHALAEAQAQGDAGRLTEALAAAQRVAGEAAYAVQVEAERRLDLRSSRTDRMPDGILAQRALADDLAMLATGVDPLSAAVVDAVSSRLARIGGQRGDDVQRAASADAKPPASSTPRPETEAARLDRLAHRISAQASGPVSASAREALLAELASLAADIPGDASVAGGGETARRARGSSGAGGAIVVTGPSPGVRAASAALRAIAMAPEDARAHGRAARLLGAAAQRARMDAIALAVAWTGIAAGAGMVDGPPSAAEPPPDQAPSTATEWARSRPPPHESVRNASSERFAEEHQEAIRAYWRRLDGAP